MSTNCFQTIKIMDICVECQYFYGKFGNKCSWRKWLAELNKIFLIKKKQKEKTQTALLHQVNPDMERKHQILIKIAFNIKKYHNL